MVQQSEEAKIAELELRERIAELKGQALGINEIAKRLDISRDTVRRAWNRAVEDFCTRNQSVVDGVIYAQILGYEGELAITRARAFGAKITDPVTKQVTIIEASPAWAHVHFRGRRDLGALVRPTQQQLFNLQMNAINVSQSADGTSTIVTEQQAAELVRREFPGDIAPRPELPGVVDMHVPPAHAVSETANDQDDEEHAQNTDARNRPRRA